MHQNYGTSYLKKIICYMVYFDKLYLDILSMTFDIN